MDEKTLGDMQHAIEDMFDCEAEWNKTERVSMLASPGIKQHFDVAMFNLTGHPKATRCYAWVNPAPGARPYVVLHGGEVIDAATAVRSVIRDANRDSQ